MNISLSPETQRLLEERMKRGSYGDPDQVVRLALETLGRVEGDGFEALDTATQEAIERAEEQAARGEGRPWEDVKETLRSRFLKS